MKARAIVDEALALEEAGACSLVVECVPAPVAKATRAGRRAGGSR
ncbi:MAG: 3-methyl-2-oxobutanoate hydroxymethyltransferase, partial [Rubrivivax sp.]